MQDLKIADWINKRIGFARKKVSLDLLLSGISHMCPRLNFYSFSKTISIQRSELKTWSSQLLGIPRQHLRTRASIEKIQQWNLSRAMLQQRAAPMRILPLKSQEPDQAQNVTQKLGPLQVGWSITALRRKEPTWEQLVKKRSSVRPLRWKWPSCLYSPLLSVCFSCNHWNLAASDLLCCLTDGLCWQLSWSVCHSCLLCQKKRRFSSHLV